MQASRDKTSHLNDLRRNYLEFFKGKGHLVYPSSSLKSDDPGLIFNVAGMQQFKPYFQGATPKFPGVDGVWPRVTTAQKCMRAGGKDSDIENVGRTRRHHTFFEMLGNFSFGDYFKREAALWAWEFLTGPEWLGLEPERLHVTVFSDDDEAYDIWANEVGIPKARLSRWGESENFWPANAIKDERSGPCGPCSEIFYDRGPDFGSPDETGPNTGAGDRYLEIWNLVFTQFNLQGGVLVPLPQQNIDTGMGFERLATVVTGAKDAYATELFGPTIRKIASLSGVPYEDLDSVPHRIIADHARSVTFAISDGILPANDGAGYVIKMLIRRAARQAYLLGLRQPVLYALVDGVVEAMEGGYPELKDNRARVKGIIRGEEEQFLRTLGAGIGRVAKLLDGLKGGLLPGEVAFDLWQTYGFPLDLTEEMAAERGVALDRAGYKRASEAAKSRSRGEREAGALFTATTGGLGKIAAEHGETLFTGYGTLVEEATVLALVKDDERYSEAKDNDAVGVVLDRTPFYAEGGGQIGDAGKLDWAGGKALVSSTTKSKEGLFIHHAKVLRGTLRAGMKVWAVVDPSRRETEKHHSATHLLHAALRAALGTHVAQAGSLVAQERLRFDFSHSQPLSQDEIRQIETLVNRWIQADLAVNWDTVPLALARERGAMMLFGEKYGESVRMVSMGGANGHSAVSIELCGGTHVSCSGELGSFVITSEEAVSSGVRRIEAVTGMAALGYTQTLRETLVQAARRLGTSPAGLAERSDKLQAELKAAEREIVSLRDKLAAAQTSGGRASDVKEAGGFRYGTLLLEGMDAAALRNAADSFLQKSKADLVVLAGGSLLVVKASPEAQTRGAHAGTLIRELAKRAGGGGGGRADMAQAGVKDPAKLEEALAALPEILSQGLGSRG